MGKTRDRSEAGPLLRPASSASSRGGIPAPTPAQEVLPILFAPLINRLGGTRVGWIGNSGKGKSCAAAWFIDEARARGFADLVFVVDDKDRETHYRGTQRVNPADAAARPPGEKEDPSAVVYRGAIIDPGRSVDVEEVCQQAWAAAQGEGHPRVLVAISELRRAVSPAGREWRGPWVPKTITEGRGPGISVSWETQSPQRIPVEAFDNSFLCSFGLGRRGRAYLERSDMIDTEVGGVISRLPPRQFVVIDDAGDWDGRVYEIPFRR